MDALGESHGTRPSLVRYHRQMSQNFMRVVLPYAQPLPKEDNLQKITGQTGEQVRVLVLKLENEMSVAEIMTSLELKGHRNFIQNYLQPALESGFIEMTQSSSPKSPTQKYPLTAKGKSLLGKGGDHI